MPNWCRNSMTAHGPLDVLAKFREMAQSLDYDKEKGTGTCLDFSRLVPEDYNDPNYQNAKDSLCETDEEYPNFNWYNWRLDHWGTKWNARYVDLEDEYFEDLGDLDYYFETAWNPPIPFFKALCKKFPELSFWGDYRAEIGETGIWRSEPNGEFYHEYCWFDDEGKAYFSDNATEVMDEAFLLFSGLKFVELPERIKKIGNCAFEGCENLERVMIPNNVVEIGRWVFKDCSSLKEVRAPKRFKEQILKDVGKGCTFVAMDR